MLDKKTKKTIEKILKEFFKKSIFDVDFEFGELHDNNLKINLKTTEPQILIGLHGQTLHALQIVLGRIVRKQLSPAKSSQADEEQDRIYLDIDINQYKQNKIKYLEELAQRTADKAALNHKPETMDAMSSYERRIVHMALAERADITTDSAGYGTERKVIVKPA